MIFQFLENTVKISVKVFQKCKLKSFIDWKSDMYCRSFVRKLLTFFQRLKINMKKIMVIVTNKLLSSFAYILNFFYSKTVFY